MTPELVIERALVRYERPLISLARGITGDLDAARDAVQETFLRLSRQDVVALEPRLAPWLFCVCRNCALDHARKVVRFPAADAPEEMPDGGAGPDEVAARSDEAAQLRRLVDGLPEVQRALVRMKFEGGLSYREMSDATRLSVSNVGVQLHHAIATLRRLWMRTASTP